MIFNATGLITSKVTLYQASTSARAVVATHRDMDTEPQPVITGIFHAEYTYTPVDGMTLKEQIEDALEDTLDAVATLQRPSNLVTILVNGGWSKDPPNEVGLWWLYGEEEFGAMGGHYTGSVPPDIELQVVKVMRLGQGDNSHLRGNSRGRLITLEPFSFSQRKPGCIGLWKKVEEPSTPEFTYRPEDYP